MYYLKNSFTGYNAKKLNLREFKAELYHLQNAKKITIEEIIDYDYPNNYFKAKVKDNTGSFYIYLNCFCGALAFGEENELQKTFFDKPILAEELSKKYEVVSSKILTTNVEEKNLSKLDKYNQREVNAWLPDTIGGLLFSWYFD